MIPLPDRRMLQLMTWAVNNGKAKDETGYWQKIGFARTSISNIKAGKQGFTRNHITAACKLTGASADWILGLSENMFRCNSAKTPVDLLRQAVAQLENGTKKTHIPIHNPAKKRSFGPG